MLPGLVSYGRTLDEAREMAQDAVTVHLRGLVKDGEDVPEDPFASGQPIAEELEVTVETMPPKLATLRAVAGSSTKRAVHMLS